MIATLLALSTLTAPAAPTTSGVFFVAPDGQHVLLRRVPGAECAGRLRLTLEGEAIVCRPPPLEAEPHLSWVGRHLTLQGGARACEAEVTGLALMAWLEPEADAGGRTTARKAWSRAGHDDRFLVATVKPRGGGAACKGARWAETGAPALHVGQSPAAVDATAALARFRAHPAYQALQSRYQAETRRAGTWDADEGTSLVVRQLPAGDATYVYAGAQVGGCGEFSADFWVIWKVTGTTWEAVTDADQVGGWFEPEALVEQGQAAPVFLDRHLRIEPRGRGYEVVEDVAVESWICPC
ncbi:MAG: hypothetical protein H6706_28025 [Myxococcales bacterium]|nr:hypothetical protein [Myxococcales bacterium]